MKFGHKLVEISWKYKNFQIFFTEATISLANARSNGAGRVYGLGV
jgi:hypothetical protein